MVEGAGVRGSQTHFLPARHSHRHAGVPGAGPWASFVVPWACLLVLYACLVVSVRVSCGAVGVSCGSVRVSCDFVGVSLVLWACPVVVVLWVSCGSVGVSCGSVGVLWFCGCVLVLIALQAGCRGSCPRVLATRVWAVVVVRALALLRLCPPQTAQYSLSVTNREGVVFRTKASIYPLLSSAPGAT